MIAKAKAIAHGINAIRYITGESMNKKHPEKIYRVLDNLLPSQLDTMGIWNSMQLTLSRFKPIKNSVIRIELSPSAEHTRFFDIEDWQKLWQDFAAEFDKQVYTDKNGKACSSPTHLANSKYTVWLHTESQGGVPHLHAAVCRIDENGHVNNDHNIHLRAQRAAERVAEKRKWTTAMQVRYGNLPQVNQDCMDVLTAMSSWSWEAYRKALIRKGYTVHEKRDRNGVLRGYALVKGNTRYKASELGVARNLMISKLPRTWEKLHAKPQRVSTDYTKYHTYRSGTVSYTLQQENQEHRFYIPSQVLDYFNDEFDYRDTANCPELTDMAVALFVGLLEAPPVATGGGGGGSQSDLLWRDKDEDDLQRAYRCARAASRLLGKKPKTGLKR